MALALAGCAGPQAEHPATPDTGIYTLNWPGSGRRAELSRTGFEALGAQTVKSAYFDRVMAYQDSTFVAVAFDTLMQRHDPGDADAVLLNCFDDYQGLVSLEDARRYRLMLATQIHLKPGTAAPDWLNPLLILVPDGTGAPSVERFMTANIREVSFVNLKRYYAPLDALAAKHPESAPALQTYKDNCVFCHSLQGVGGNKGGVLAARFDFSRAQELRRFEEAFLAMHQDNPDKQNVAQFIPRESLAGLAVLLKQAAGP